MFKSKELIIPSFSKVFKVYLNLEPEYRKILAETILEVGDERSNPNTIKAFMTNYYVWEQSPNFNKFLLKVKECLEIVSPVSLEHHEFKLIDTWGIIYKEGDFALPHQHLGHGLSWVYYVQTGDNPTPLIFNDSNFELIPENDMIVFFPSHLTHSVPTHKGSDRIIISGNIQWDSIITPQ